MRRLFYKDINRTKSSIHNILLSSYLITMLVILCLTTLIYVIAQYYNMKSNITTSIRQTCLSVANDVDTQINQLDSVGINVLYSNIIKDSFSAYTKSTGEVDPNEQRVNYTLLTSLLTSLRGANSTVRQINIYDLKRGCFGTGNYTGYQDIVTTDQQWYEPVIAQDGGRYIPPAAQNKLISDSSGTSEDRYYISLYRLYYDNFHQPGGIVEIMQYYDITFNRALNPDSPYDIQVIIYDPDGNVIFPLHTEKDDLFDYFSHRMDNELTLQNTKTHQDEYVYYGQMERCGFTTVVAIERAKIFSPIYKYLMTIFLILILLILICVMIAYKLSKRLSAPLTQMYHFLSDPDIPRRFGKLSMKDSDILEIDKLKDSLNEFQDRQKNSLDTLMLLKEQELQAEILALQSQMNPHFLYNSLANLGAMAEEGMTAQICQMCIDITAILRYISSNQEPLSTLEKELEHASRYLKCLMLRYEGSLTYTIDVPDEMLELKMPKLCIQLLVENAVKFSAKTAPPWHISIEGFLTDKEWIISVKDNGIGFNTGVIQTLNKKLEAIKQDGLLPGLELDGMGLLNIYMRFYLIYHAAFIFDFGNLENKGAIVSIGGKIHE